LLLPGLALALLLVPGFHAAHAQKPPNPPKPHPEVQALLDQGDAAKKSGKRDEALKLFTAAQDKARALRDQEGEAIALENAGYCYSDAGQNQKALEYFEPAAALFRAVGDRAGEARTRRAEAQALFNIGKV